MDNIRRTRETMHKVHGAGWQAKLFKSLRRKYQRAHGELAEPRMYTEERCAARAREAQRGAQQPKALPPSLPPSVPASLACSARRACKCPCTYWLHAYARSSVVFFFRRAAACERNGHPPRQRSWSASRFPTGKFWGSVPTSPRSVQRQRWQRGRERASVRCT